MDELVPALRQSIFNDSLADGVASIAEVGIDSILSEGLLKDLPIFSLILGASRTIKNIQERNLLKNTAIFLNEINSQEIDQLKLQKYKEKLNDKKTAERELGRVLILLNQYVDNLKSRMLGRLFQKYVDQTYSWEKFCELSDILGRLFLADISYLFEIENTEKTQLIYHIYKIPYNIRRLQSLGLVEVYGEYSRFGDRLLQTENMYAELTANGKIFTNLGQDLNSGMSI